MSWFSFWNLAVFLCHDFLFGTSVFLAHLRPNIPKLPPTIVGINKTINCPLPFKNIKSQSVKYAFSHVTRFIEIYCKDTASISEILVFVTPICKICKSGKWPTNAKQIWIEHNERKESYRDFEFTVFLLPHSVLLLHSVVNRGYLGLSGYLFSYGVSKTSCETMILPQIHNMKFLRNFICLQFLWKL